MKKFTTFPAIKLSLFGLISSEIRPVFLFLTTLYETCTLNLAIIPFPLEQQAVQTKNLWKKTTRIEFRDTGKRSSRVIDIFALRQKITRYNGDKLSRPLPLLSSLVEKHRTIFIFASNGWNCHKAVQSSGPDQSSRWPQERTHFEFGSNEIYHCDVTGSDNPPKYGPSETILWISRNFKCAIWLFASRGCCAYKMKGELQTVKNLLWSSALRSSA